MLNSPQRDSEFFEDDQLEHRVRDGQHLNGSSGVEIVSIMRNEAEQQEII
jgi:hypothetical protein